MHFGTGAELALVPPTGSRRAATVAGSGRSGPRAAGNGPRGPQGWHLEGHPQGTRLSHGKKHQVTLIWLGSPEAQMSSVPKSRFPTAMWVGVYLQQRSRRR